MSARLVLEVPRTLTRCRRMDAAEALVGWLSRSGAIAGLPDAEVIVEATAGRQLPISLVGGRASVGTFLLRNGDVFPDEFRVVAALGAHRDEDRHDWQASLGTIPHELVHVAQFAAFFGGRTPAAVARAAIAAAPAHTLPAVATIAAFAPWARLDHEAGGYASPEMLGRRVITAFLGAYPIFAAVPECPANCPHWPR